MPKRKITLLSWKIDTNQSSFTGFSFSSCLVLVRFAVSSSPVWYLKENNRWICLNRVWLFDARHPRCLICPGVVNRTFENRTQSNSIELNPWIEFDWVRQSNEIEHHTFSEFDFRTNRIQSNKSNSIELNPSDWVRLSSETELNRTQLNGFRSIGSGESIQREP